MTIINDGSERIVKKNGTLYIEVKKIERKVGKKATKNMILTNVPLRWPVANGHPLDPFGDTSSQSCCFMSQFCGENFHKKRVQLNF